MPSKLQFYSEFAERTARQITGSYRSWTAFLATAARLYKYPYNEQLMANSDERAGQPESMEQVIALYYDQIYKFCYWKTHSAVDAQDITQDTFIRFMDAAQTYSDIESPKALLYTIAHHLCLNWLKKVPPDSLDELRWDQEPAAEDFADHAIRKIYLSTTIAALPNEQQEVLLLRYGQDLKVGEIAEILGLSRFQVMYRVRGALRQLKKLLKEESP